MHRGIVMQKSNRGVVVAAFAVAVGLAACTPVSTDYVREHEPAHAEPIEGTDLHRVILEPDAAERLGLETAPVREATRGGTQMLVIPYRALYYDPQGVTWAYTQEEALTFVRARIKVDHIEGPRVMLTDGPAPGTEVVTIGVQELVGVETGVGH
jgi:hypothetical protein